MNKKVLGVIFMVMAAFGLAVAVFLIKVIQLFTNISPQHIAIWRFIIAAPALWIIYFLKEQPKSLDLKHSWWFSVMGVVLSISSFSAVFALQRLSSSIYIIVCFIYPSLVVLYSFFSGSAVPRLFWLGMPLTLFGLLLTTFEFGSVFAIDPIGLLITIVNASALAAYMILSGKVFKTVQNKLPGTTIAMSAAMLVGIILIPFLGIEIPNTLEGWVMLVLLSTIGTVMPFFAMNYGLSLLTTARGSIIITIQPVLTVLLGMIFLNETLTLQQWIGGGLVILAIILLERSPDRALTRAVKSES